MEKIYRLNVNIELYSFVLGFKIKTPDGVSIKIMLTWYPLFEIYDYINWIGKLHIFNKNRHIFNHTLCDLVFMKHTQGYLKNLKYLMIKILDQNANHSSMEFRCVTFVSWELAAIAVGGFSVWNTSRDNIASFQNTKCTK